MDGTIRVEAVIEILVDPPGLKETCEEYNKDLLDTLKELTLHFLAEGILGHEALEFRLVSGPVLKG